MLALKFDEGSLDSLERSATWVPGTIIHKLIELATTINAATIIIIYKILSMLHVVLNFIYIGINPQHNPARLYFAKIQNL